MSSYFSLFSQIYHLQERLLTSKLKKHPKLPISTGQMKLLMSLWENDQISINEIVKRNCLKKSTISTMLPRLEAAELIEIKPNLNDKRIKNVKLTKNAVELKNNHLKIVAIIEKEIFKDINEDEKEIFFKLLNIIKNNLIKKEKLNC